MPHQNNVDAPITLISAGRSGTSLCAQLFDRHPDCSAVGETGKVIFEVWNAVRTAAPTLLPLTEGGRPVPEDERAARVVREAFLTCFPDDRTSWMQKPIGIPRLMRSFDDPGGTDAARSYWQVMRASFPKARYFTILRHPCDVVLSSCAYWGRDEQAIWCDLGWMARYLMDADSPVHHAVRYDHLVRDPEATSRELFSAMEIPFHENVLSAFGETHVPAPGRKLPALSRFSRRHEWAKLNPQLLAPSHRQAITQLFEKFGWDLEWPEHFAGVSHEADAGMGGIESDRATINQLQGQLERIHSDYHDRILRREQEVTQLWSEQQAWIVELERSKAWLDEQRRYWQKRATPCGSAV